MSSSSVSKPLAIDPVCGMKIDPERARGGSVEHAGTAYYFCNPKCRERFLADPEKYLAPKPATETPARAPEAAKAQSAPETKSSPIYLCPMDPEVRSDKPGACPKCGMALELAEPALKTDSAELDAMSRRFAVACAFALPLFALAMGSMVAPHFAAGLFSARTRGLLEFALATPVVAWCGLPFFERALASLKNRSANMFTLIGLGVSAAYFYSVVALFAPSLFPSALEREQGELGLYFEAAAVIVTLVLLGQVLELRARARTSSAIRGLLELAPETARRLDDHGEERDVPLAEIRVGDRLRVRPGAKVPVDGSILDGESHLDEALITGEPTPLHKRPGDRLIGGTVNGMGSLVMRADHIGKDALLARIVSLVSEAQRSRAPIQKLVDRVASFFVPSVIGVALGTFLIWFFWGPEPRLAHALINAVAVLIVACPCALGLATPMSTLVASGKGASHGVLFKNAEALERLAKVDTLLLDKTGTLTEGRPRVVDVIAHGNIDEATLLRRAASLELRSEHPLGKALVEAARERGIALTEPSAFESIAGQGIRGTVDEQHIFVGNARFFGAEQLELRALEQRAAELEARNSTVVYVAIEREVVGLCAIADPIKSNAARELRALQTARLRVVMLSGDTPRAANAVAAELGLGEVIAGVMPQQKAEHVARLQKEGRVVAMAGDGVNDAPALARADVGIAMGTGADIAIESAGVTLLGGELGGILRARTLSRLTLKNIEQNLFFAFAYNALGVPIAAGVLYPFFGLILSPMIAAAAMSVSSVSVIANALRLQRATL
ncbi:MAG TPA: heavy metal translocating P-type ATPase [Polyangiaceae bacterium]|jgi:Cu+-exporting ATPase|nr:heavy metal translocating P-type ATPase [Polyangiaceae bacterium]